MWRCAGEQVHLKSLLSIHSCQHQLLLNQDYYKLINKHSLDLNELSEVFFPQCSTKDFIPRLASHKTRNPVMWSSNYMNCNVIGWFKVMWLLSTMLIGQSVVMWQLSLRLLNTKTELQILSILCCYMHTLPIRGCTPPGIRNPQRHWVASNLSMGFLKPELPISNPNLLRN